MDVLRDMKNYLIPKKIPDHFWDKMLKCSIEYKRKSTYEWLFGEEKRKEKRVRHQVKRRELYLQKLEENRKLIAEGVRLLPTHYPGYRSIYRYIQDNSFNKLQRRQKLFVAARLEDFVVIDCGFEHEMTRDNYLLSLLRKLYKCYDLLYKFHSPSQLYLCNVISDVEKAFKTTIEGNMLDSLLFQSTTKSYLDIFPKEKLIYLTPDSENEMETFDHDAIYVIGGIFDNTKKVPITYEKAQHENIRHQRLPLDRYLKFHETSSKALAMNQVYKILMTLKHTNNNWYKAFKYVANKKIATRYMDENNNDIDELDEDIVQDDEDD
ncbi:unnamed protein product [Didymodactylos carnosus]|uniref:RNA (guanine-9-)-methyltransferase domain-containing protein 1 n=1 Tax=Didymodactylos carnosus TaxID=1234261 RepID=A0A813Y5Q7_9BILA|nr:unnamed protein product [Didymodactylos carnosus]CAF0878456.1 unnamed protein product [Didymodactylos carnosus]CAF3603639.1 unnamed protein product [Didymodactylos carnosus]CAF3665020.1 unnamed protein product [Didymodactylos carnosus]